MRFKLLAFTSLGAFAASMISGSASAQEASSPPKDQLGEIVVTAEKRPSVEQKTPIAMTVVTGAALAASGIKDVGQLTAVAPTLNIASNNSNTLFTIRGVSSRDYTETGDPAIAISIDNFYLQRSLGLNAALFDIDHVEVLRGPQGTLYGRNATGGAINISTAKPVLGKYMLNASAEIGNYGALDLGAMVNVPVGDTLAIRASGSVQTHNGYSYNAPETRGDDQDTKAARLRVLWKPTSRLTVNLTGEYIRAGGVGAVIKGLPYSAVQPNGSLAIGSDSDWVLNHQGFTRLETKASRWSLDYDLGFGSLSYMGGYQDMQFNRDNDQDGGILANYGFQQNEHVRTQNHEIRFTSDWGGPFALQAGLYYFQEKDTLLTFFQVHGLEVEPFNYFKFDYNVESKSKAAFAQASYNLTDTLKVEGGVRYTQDNKSQVGENDLAGTLQTLDNHYSSHKLTWHGAVDWQVTPHNLFYAKIDRGYKAGGYTASGQFGPEVITAYEAGSKNRFFNNKLELNLDAFLYDYTNLQVPQADPNNPANSTVLNAGKARLYGVEGEATFLLSANDKLNANVSLLHAQFTQFCTVQLAVCPAGLSYAGNQLPQAPKLSLGGGYEHSFDVFSGRLTARAQTRYQSKTFFTYRNSEAEKMSSYTKTDLSLSYTPDTGPWSVMLFVRNLEDNRVLTDSEEAGYAGGYIVQFSDPRTYGGRISVHF